MKKVEYGVKYISGGNNVYTQGNKIMKISDEGIFVGMIWGKEKDLFAWEDILKVEIESEIEKKRISLGKAVGGGILLGPIGAVIGGVAGSKKTHTSVLISYLTAAKSEKVLILSANTNQANKIKQDIDRELTERFDSTDRTNSDAKNSTEPQTDKLAALERLSSLRKDGALTDEEFQEQKKQLLSK